MSSIFYYLVQYINPMGAVFVISMIPLIELRGSVIVGTAFGLPWLQVLLVSIIGNLLPIPFILIFGKRLLEWAKRLPLFAGFFQRYETKLYEKSGTIQKYAFFGIWIFVGIPLPGTGAWSGSLIATLLEVPPKTAFPAVICGVLTAGVIMTLGSQGVVGLIHLLG